MVVTYRDLTEGYTLKDRDTLACIHGITGYMVLLNTQGEYQLFHPSIHSGEIYRLLEGKSKIPMWKTPSELTQEVLRLYKTPKFKVGERVIIAKLTQDSDCPYGVNYDMIRASGLPYVVQEVEFDYDPMSLDQEVTKWKGDFHRYHIGRVCGIVYHWHSSMFVPRQESKPQETQLVSRSYEEQREIHRREEEKRKCEENVPLPISFVLGSHRCDIVEGSAGWFLSGGIRAVLEEAGIEHNIEEILVKNGIEVVSPGIFPFVSSAGELEKAIAIVKTYWNNSRSKNTEVAKEDMAQMLNESREQLLEAIDVHPNSKVNTDIVL